MSPLTTARLLTTLLAAAALGACGSSGPGNQTTATPPAATPTPTPTPTPNGPATANFTFTGDAALTAPLSNVNVECQVPSFNGPYIGVSAKLPSGLVESVAIGDGKVSVQVAIGSAQTLTERTFTGTGTSGFDAAKGAQVSGSLTDSTPATTNKGTIGALTGISGSVSCGNQTMGTTSLRITGTDKEGAVDITLSPARVQCLNGTSGIFVGSAGILTVNGAQELVIVSLGQSSLQVALERPSGPNHFFIVQGQAGTTVTSTGGHADGTATVSEQGAPTGVTPGTVHVTGDATCGSSGTY